MPERCRQVLIEAVHTALQPVHTGHQIGAHARQVIACRHLRPELFNRRQDAACVVAHFPSFSALRRCLCAWARRRGRFARMASSRVAFMYFTIVLRLPPACSNIQSVSKRGSPKCSRNGSHLSRYSNSNLSFVAWPPCLAAPAILLCRRASCHAATASSAVCRVCCGSPL